MNEAVTAAADMLADALCLCMALRMMGRRVRAGRVAAAGALGAALAVIARRAGLSGPNTALLWLPVALAMARIACGRGRAALRGAFLLLASEGLLGGTVLALRGATGSLAAAWSIGTTAFALMAVSALRARRTAADVTHLRIVCTVRGRTAAFEAILDSGNSLRDYLTHRPVVVVPETTARRRLSLGADVPLRALPADTAGGRCLLLCVTPEQTRLIDGKRQLPARCVLALSPGLAPHAPALVPPSLLQQDESTKRGI